MNEVQQALSFGTQRAQREMNRYLCAIPPSSGNFLLLAGQDSKHIPCAHPACSSAAWTGHHAAAVPAAVGRAAGGGPGLPIAAAAVQRVAAQRAAGRAAGTRPAAAVGADMQPEQHGGRYR